MACACHREDGDGAEAPFVEEQEHFGDVDGIRNKRQELWELAQSKSLIDSRINRLGQEYRVESLDGPMEHILSHFAMALRVYSALTDSLLGKALTVGR